MLFDVSVVNYFNKLIDKLFEEDYFSYKESAKFYVDKLINQSLKRIKSRKHFITPATLAHFGESFIHVSINKNTTWYILFKQRENRILVTHVFNNHSKEASKLNA